jgi:phosphoglycerol transferase MdoB-like AlkP superfamily enzyme
MPHPPFYYTKQGKQTDKKTLIEESNDLSPNSYLGYIPKTNKVIKQIVNSILDHAKKPVVVILMGDHGFRTNQPANFHFRSQNAVYVSFKNMKDLYPNISNVNEFRVLLNDLFRTNYPLLKDSTEFLIDK